MGTIRYYAVSPDVAAKLAGNPDFRIWLEPPPAEGAQRRDTPPAKAPAFSVVATSGNVVPEGGTVLIELTSEKDPPPPPPLRDPGESLASYQQTFRDRIDVLRSFRG